MSWIVVTAIVLAVLIICGYVAIEWLACDLDDRSSMQSSEPYVPITAPEPQTPPLEVTNSADDLCKRYVFVKSVPAVCPDCERLIIDHKQLQPGAYVLCSGMIGLISKD